MRTNHRKALEKIAACPSEFGFEAIIATSIEPTLLDEKKRTIAQPDLILYDIKGNVYIVEYKSNGNLEELKRAQEQLFNAVQWFSRYTPISPKVKIIYGKDFKKISIKLA